MRSKNIFISDTINKQEGVHIQFPEYLDVKLYRTDQLINRRRTTCI